MAEIARAAGISTVFQDLAVCDLLSITREALELSRSGLARRQKFDPYGADETRYLKPLDEFAERGETPAEELLRKFHGPWGGVVDPVFTEYAY